MSELIKKLEGYKSTAYQCEAGVWTIGWGCTTYQNGQPVKKGDRITKAEAESLFQYHMSKIKVPMGLNKSQVSALQSLIFNIGQRAFDNSKLKKAIIEKDWPNVFRNWDWIKAGGNFSRGLAKRRAEELALFFDEKL